MMWNTNQSFTLNIGLNSEIYKELRLIWIQPGVFMMGSPLDEPGRNDYDDEPPFEVIISKGFWLSEYVITNAQWLRLMGNLPYQFINEIANNPVTNVSWYDALEFCNKLKQLFEKELPVGYQFSLPTEAQWEYACRAGTQSIYHSGNSIEDLDRVAWHKNNSLGYVHAVGEKAPNAWGLYDMHGNVCEWCYDMPSPYPFTPTTDWIGTNQESVEVRVIRGEPWSSPPTSPGFRSSCRGEYPPNGNLQYIGFRVSLRIP